MDEEGKRVTTVAASMEIVPEPVRTLDQSLQQTPKRQKRRARVRIVDRFMT